MPESKANPSATRQKSWIWLAVLAMMIVPGIVSLLYLRSAPRKPLDSLAVLPFAYSPDQPAIATLSNQLTDGLIKLLQRNSRLTVVPSEAVAAYRGDSRPAL